MSTSDLELRIIGSIKLAADNISVLRKLDVYRVLEDASQQNLLTEAADYIIAARADLNEEVLSCKEELEMEIFSAPTAVIRQVTLQENSGLNRNLAQSPNSF